MSLFDIAKLHLGRAKYHRFGGTGYIAGEAPGLVTIAGQPGRAMVRLHDQATGRLVAQTISNPDGSYAFRDLNIHRRYVVTAYDPQGIFNPAVQDLINPEPMP